MLLKVHIKDRSYNNWSWSDGLTLESVECHLIPVEFKLFSDDIIKINDGNNIKIVHSSLRQMNYIPGILNVTGKTYGRIKGKLLYQCIPDDKRIPIFLVPYMPD